LNPLNIRAPSRGGYLNYDAFAAEAEELDKDGFELDPEVELDDVLADPEVDEPDDEESELGLLDLPEDDELDDELESLELEVERESVR